MGGVVVSPETWLMLRGQTQNASRPSASIVACARHQSVTISVTKSCLHRAVVYVNFSGRDFPTFV